MGKMELEPGLYLSYEAKLCQIKTLLEKSQEFKEEFYTVRKCGMDIAVFKNVFSPGYFEDSEYFANYIQNVEGLKVLEIGTGTGLIALKCAMGKAKKVVATDINPDAIKNAEYNVKNHKMESVIELQQGYIFQPLRRDYKFDLIFWNIPFCYVDAETKSNIGLHDRLSDLEKSAFDPYYYYLFDYLNEGFNFLSKKGKLLLGFSPTIGRADRLEEITNDLNLVITVLKEDEVEIEGHTEVLQILEFKKSND